MLKLSACVLLCLLATGCSSSASSSHQLTGQALAAISPSDVVVFSEPPQQYSEIAIVTATSGASTTAANKTKTDQVLNALKAEAAALGANGIVITLMQEDARLDKVPISDGTQGGIREVTKYYQTARASAVFVD
tara:strand:- start:1471 stop:1872 length:402 start_codon:yes stop_codon:yes gene_type:complete